MPTKLATVGYLSDSELAGLLPAEERLRKGPVAVIECIQDIPCNPCEQACRFQAITVGQPITSLPVLDEAACIGCGACIAKCPGLAIFVVDCSRLDDVAVVQLPYEYHPKPVIGEQVEALDRRGTPVTHATVTRIVTQDHTAVVTMEVPKQYANVVRGIRPLRRDCP